jgi:alpha-N-acetylglucosamine transferase
MASKYAYVTLVTNTDYIAGAVALIRSLKRTGTGAELVVMHTGAVSASELETLAVMDARLRAVELLGTSGDFNERHARRRLHAEAPFLKGKKPSFHTPLDNFAKLRLWELKEYEKCVFIDADAIVLRNIDRLFAYPEFSAAPNVYESLTDFQRMNSGVFVARPSLKTFDTMMKHLDRPGQFWKRTDQTFLEDFFPRWHGLPVFFNMLQYVWFNLPQLWDWRSVQVIHFQYEKPWQKDNPKADMLRPLIDLWNAFHSGADIPEIDKLQNPVSSR